MIAAKDPVRTNSNINIGDYIMKNGRYVDQLQRIAKRLRPHEPWIVQRNIALVKTALGEETNLVLRVVLSISLNSNTPANGGPPKNAGAGGSQEASSFEHGGQVERQLRFVVAHSDVKHLMVKRLWQLTFTSRGRTGAGTSAGEVQVLCNICD